MRGNFKIANAEIKVFAILTDDPPKNGTALIILVTIPEAVSTVT